MKHSIFYCFQHGGVFEDDDEDEGEGEELHFTLSPASTDERVAKFNEHAPYKGHKFFKAKYLTTSWPKMKKEQKDKFVYIYEQFPEGQKIQALAAYDRKVNADQQQQQS